MFIVDIDIDIMLVAVALGIILVLGLGSQLGKDVLGVVRIVNAMLAKMFVSATIAMLSIVMFLSPLRSWSLPSLFLRFLRLTHCFSKERLSPEVDLSVATNRLGLVGCSFCSSLSFLLLHEANNDGQRCCANVIVTIAGEFLLPLVWHGFEEIPAHFVFIADIAIAHQMRNEIILVVQGVLPLLNPHCRRLAKELNPFSLVMPVLGVAAKMATLDCEVVKGFKLNTGSNFSLVVAVEHSLTSGCQCNIGILEGFACCTLLES